MMKRKLIYSVVTAAALLLPAMLHAQVRDSVIFDLNIVDSADSVYAPATEVKDTPSKGKKLSNKEIKRMTDTLTFDNLYLDTVVVKKKNLINDYSMVGVYYGAGVASAIYNPSRAVRFVFVPKNFGITYTRYGKMFNYMPYFGFQASLNYNTEGYRFKIDKDTNEPSYLESGADKAFMTTLDGTMNAHCHVDFWKMKLIVNVGYYVGYRMSITRYRDGEIISTDFNDYDRRFDYGVKGGVGFGFVFDPIELHIQAMYKHSFQNLYDPDYASEYYYRYANPYGVVVSAGIHVQLTKRTGKTTKQIKAEAKEAIFKEQ